MDFSFLHVVSLAGSGCEGCCCEGNESLVCLEQRRKVLCVPIDIKHEAVMLVVSFSPAFSVFGFHIREVRNLCLLPLRREVSGL